ncbi:MAG: signal recognition particle-docking protein FtsY [Fidelibacterota bacterium]
MLSIFKKTVSGLSKTRQKIANIFVGLTGKKYLSPDDLDQLEEVLLQADLGWEVVDKVIDDLKKPDDESKDWSFRFIDSIKQMLNGEIQAINESSVILLVGINGTGKTTSAAKLAGYFSRQNEKVLLVAADTYRAAAVEQIREWSRRLNVNLVANEGSGDPGAIVFDGIKAGLSRNMDRIIVDTAGRLHTSKNLMQELSKIYRVANKITDDLTVFITIDANTGQNGFTQVREFNNSLPIDGVILTKMDGTAKGGIAIPIMLELNLPICYMGVGEQIDDLIQFNLDDYLTGLTGSEKGIDEKS